MPAEVIDFNKSPQRENKTEGPAEQESRSTAKLVNELLRRSQRATQELRAQWPENYRYVVNGQQWPVRRPRYRFSEVVNITWANIMQEVALQTDSRPVVDFNAVEPSDFKFAQVLKKVNEVNWRKSETTGHDWERKTANAIFKSKMYHVMHSEVLWDPEMENGLGDIKYRVLDPFGCFWDPTADDVFENRWFIHAEPVPTSKMKKDYPDFAERIKPDVTLFSLSGSDGIDDHNVDLFFHQGVVGPGFNPAVRSDREDTQFGGEPMTLKIRCWLQDDTVEEIVNEKDLGQGEVEKEHIQVKKFPKGRYIEVANNITLLDIENEYEDGHFPIARLVNYDYGEYAGDPEVTHMKGPQNIVNYVWSFILDSMKMANNPQNIIATADQDIAKKLTNEPGLNVIVSDPSNFRREAGPGIPPGMFQIFDRSISNIDNVSGLRDVAKGGPDPSITSGLQFEGFVEAAQTRPRMKNRSVDKYLKQVGYLMASRYLQYYTQPRVFRITNEEGFPEFITFFIEKGEEGDNAVIQRAVQAEEGGEFINEAPQTFPIKKGIPDINIVSGSSLPFARSQKTQTALTLHERQAITLESLLKAVNWDNPEEEVQKVQEEQAKVAEQQAAQGPPQ